MGRLTIPQAVRPTSFIGAWADGAECRIEGAHRPRSYYRLHNGFWQVGLWDLCGATGVGPQTDFWRYQSRLGCD